MATRAHIRIHFPYPWRAFNLLFLTGLLFVCPEAIVFGQARPTAQEVTIEKRLVEGKKYTLLGDWEKAEAIFKAIVEEDVQNSAAYYELSRTLAASGKTSEGLTNIRKAIRIEPDNEWYHLMEADIHEQTGDIAAAMEVYDRLIKLRPQKAHYYEMQISFCKRTGENERLLKVLNDYENIRGVNESITRTRFETLDEMGRKEEALATLDRLTVVFPSNTSYKFLAASYAVKIGQESKAQQYYRDVLALEPENTRAKLALAGTEKQAGDDAGYLQSISPVISNPEVNIDVKLQELIPYVIRFSESKDATTGNALLDLTSQLVKAHPKEAKSFAIHGDVLSILGKDQAAIEAYKQSTQLNGDVYLVWEQLLALLKSRRQYDELIRQANLAMEQFPNHAYIYYAAGYGYYKTRQNQDALDKLNEALIMSGRNTGQKINIYNILGLTYDELGDLEKSSLAFETSINLDPKNAETLTHYSFVLSRRIASSEKAKDMSDRALAQAPHPAAIQEMLALSLYNQKRYPQALSTIQHVLNTDPYGDAYNLAGDILIKMEKPAEAVDMWQKAIEEGSQDPELKRKIAEHKTP